MAPESYRISRAANGLLVTASDPAGAMYGGLDISEHLAIATNPAAFSLADDRLHQPHVAERGIKFNIPLDLRTPSLSDGGTNAQANIPEVWDLQFWAAYFDHMARYRYNVLSLWNSHPFPSMIRVPEYPDVALDDVWRTRQPMGPVALNGMGKNNVPSAFLANHEVVKRITIDQKIAFWRTVMQMAHDRGIDIYIFAWNVFTYGAEGKHGIDNNMSNPATIAYMRASVRELIRTYPLLRGIGITAGENMVPNNPDFTPEAWLWATYGEGVRDAIQREPHRDFRLIHRFHMTAKGEIEKNWSKFPGYPASFTFSYKYSVAHMYSSPRPTFINAILPHMAGSKTWLTVRNDDFYSFHWGDPDFAREYVLNMPPPETLSGFYMGPDGYVWGRDFLDRDFDGSRGQKRPLVLAKQWYGFMLWGRLSYDPALTNTHFQRVLGARFPEVDAGDLFTASTAASQVIPLITRFFWHDIDIAWLPEANAYNDKAPRSFADIQKAIRCGEGPGCGDLGRSAFYTVADVMAGAAMPGEGILSIRQWRTNLRGRLPMRGQTPLDIAAALADDAHTAIHLAGKMRAAAAGNAELRSTLADYEAMGQLGLYYSEKILAAAHLALFDDGSSEPEQERQLALAHLDRALAAWRAYAAIRDAQYVPAFYSRIGWIDLTALTEGAAADLAIARDWKPGSLSAEPDGPPAKK
ncbi:hypothetical protein [Novosphingobium sp. BL-52-GroH]|uniref:hypothetical protein n=1 Tax=Novosphingobium sp. BL-52-GroH TaxID=3349877 RepID=UPI00384C11EF